MNPVFDQLDAMLPDLAALLYKYMLHCISLGFTIEQAFKLTNDMQKSFIESRK